MTENWLWRRALGKSRSAASHKNVSEGRTKLLAVQMGTADVPRILAAFAAIVGENHWIKRARKIKTEIQGKPRLRLLLEQENEIAVSLARCSELTARYGVLPPGETLIRQHYGAFALAAQVVSIADRLPAVAINRLVRRLHGAFKNPEGMRAFRLELTVATHFVRRGFRVSFPEVDGTGLFDVLVHDLGPRGLELECKSVSEDKGRKVHRRDALEFHSLLERPLTQASGKLTCGLAIVVTVPDRLPQSDLDRKKLAAEVVRSALSGQQTRVFEGNQITTQQFDPTLLGATTAPRITHELVDAITGTKNREAMVLGSNAGGAVVVVVQSQKDDNLLRYVVKALKDAAKHQLSTERPGVLIAGFEALTGDALRMMAEQELSSAHSANALRVMATNFLASVERDHVVGVGFISAGALEPRNNGAVSNQSVTYFFPRRESGVWHADLNSLFSDFGES